MDENVAGAGRENDELEWGRRHVREGTATEPVQDVFRKTELHNTPPPEESELRKLRQQMMKRLKHRDPEILYQPFETSFREFVCSLLVRQYREEEERRQQLAAHWELLGILEERLDRKTDQFERRLDEMEERGRH